MSRTEIARRIREIVAVAAAQDRVRDDQVQRAASNDLVREIGGGTLHDVTVLLEDSAESREDILIVVD
jgi:hypothetical protein